MSGLTVKVDFTGFTATLTKYALVSRKTVKEVVAKKFRDVRTRLLKLHLETRPETLDAIRIQAPQGLKFSDRTLKRIGIARRKATEALSRAKKAYGKKGKRGEMAAFRILKATAELQRMKEDNQRIGWAMEKKQREDAAGRAGAWGWKTKGSDFDSIASANLFAKVDRRAGLFETSLSVTNLRPNSNEFAERKGIIKKALDAVEKDMIKYITPRLSRLK